MVKRMRIDKENIFALLAIIIFIACIVLTGCDKIKCNPSAKINLKTGEKYIGVNCGGDW